MNKKVLIISPTPTHPTIAGNRARILNIVELLKQNGFEVHFLFVEYEKGDLDGMKNYFGKHFYYYNIKPENENGFWKKIKKNYKRTSCNFKQKIIRGFYSFRYSAEQLKYNHLLDDFYNEGLSDFTRKIQNKEKFRNVIVEYVYISKVLKVFDNSVNKLLDLHDLLSDRYKIFLEKGIQPQWYSLFRTEERKGMNRADILIAIQDNEKENILKMTDKPVILLGHNLASNNVVKSSSTHKRLLFVASENFINVEGINHFIKKCLPGVKIKHPAVTLLLAGSIVQAKNKIMKDEALEFLGEFDDIQNIYKRGDVVINPVNFGTGLKIKTIEALSYGQPLVTYKEGISGLEFKHDTPFCLIAKDEKEFSEHICTLFDNPDVGHKLSLCALEFAEQYNKGGLEEFLKMLK